MRNISVFVLVAATSLPAAPLLASQLTGAAAQAQPVVVGRTVVSSAQAQISGTVVTQAGEPMANAVVRARNLLNGDIGGSTSTATRGEFAIAVNPGSYMLEIADPGGQIVGTSSFISAAPGTAVTAMVTASTGMLSATAGATGLVATLGATAARSMAFAAAAAGVAGVVTPQNTVTASPSR